MDINPLTGEKYSTEYYEIKKKIDELPASHPEVQKELREKFNTADVLIVKAETGAGKGVVVSPSILKFTDYKARIVSTQPRSLNTEVAKYVAKVLDSPNVGKHVGYSYRFEKHADENTLLTYMTDGMLVNYFYKDPLISSIDVVIIDEVHERNISIDTLLLFCKRILQKLKDSPSSRKPFKLVIMSATMDPKIYQKYFSDFSVETIIIRGRAFPVKSIFTETAVEEYLPKIKETLITICKSGPGDILVFLPSSSEINKMCNYVNGKEFKKDSGETPICFTLYRGISEDQKELAQSSDKYKSLKVVNSEGKEVTPSRKIVMSTNIAESGVTIDGVLWVVDSGRRYESSYIAEKRMRVLENTFVSRSEIEQRMGRAGRTAAGTCYHIYTEKQFKDLPYDKSAEIKLSRIDGTFINFLRVMRLEECIKFFAELMDPPTKAQLHSALSYIKDLHLIDNNGLTELGQCVAKIPLDIEYALALIASKHYGVLEEVKQICAMSSIDPDISGWFDEPPKDSPNYLKYKKKMRGYENDKADVFALHKLFTSFLSRRHRMDEHTLRKWCKDEFIKYNSMIKAFKVLKQLNEDYSCSHFPRAEKAATVNKNLTYAFIHGFRKNIANKEDGYILPNKDKVAVSPGVGNILTKLSDTIMYTEYIQVLGKKKISGLYNISGSPEYTDLMEKLA